MPGQRKFDEETRARAVRLYVDRRRDHALSESKLTSRKEVDKLLDINAATLRNWVEEVERAQRPDRPGGQETVDLEEVRALRQRVAELERANDILKTASAFFAQPELDRRLK